MNKLLKSIVLLIAVSLIFSAYTEASRGIKTSYVSPTGAAVTGDNWLFVIGINNYQTWPRLETAVNDAKSLKDVLLDRYRYDKKRVVELYNEKATRKNIIGNLRYLAKNVKKDDSLVIFYAGHGYIDSITKEGSWIPVNGDLENSAFWVSNHDIKKYLNVDAIKAKHILLISDSCFSGDFFRSKRGRLPAVTPEVIKKAFKLTSRQAITSGGLEPVSDTGFGNNSVFSHFFIKTLKENTNPFLIPSELFPDVKAGVAENAEQFPQFGSLHGTGGQQGGELVFFLQQEAQLTGLSASVAQKNKELERLKQLETEERLAQKRESDDIAKQKKELSLLDSKISAMKQRLGTASEQKNDSLKSMLAMVRKKEAQKKKLEDLKYRKAKEAKKRQAEIRQLRKQAREKKLLELKKDIRDYNEIVASDYGKEMADGAWELLIKKYPVRAEGVKKGDVKKLLSPGWLKIDTRPENAVIRLTDTDQEYARGMALDPGTYSAVVSAEGYFSKRLDISIKAGESTRPYANLKRGYKNSIGMTFAYIKPGTFKMGTKKLGSEEKPVHKVTLTKGFYMQTTEVTQAQWWEVMRTTPSHNKTCGATCPVENVSWNDAQRFIKKLNQNEGNDKYRLPTEAEWEYACRAGSDTPYANGNSLDDMGWYKEDWPLASKRTQPVALKKANKWGLYDMHGNVQEWCQDWYDDYPEEAVTDPAGGPEYLTNRVLRSGSVDSKPDSCMSASRDYGNPQREFLYQGFRLVRNP